METTISASGTISASAKGNTSGNLVGQNIQMSLDAKKINKAIMACISGFLNWDLQLRLASMEFHTSFQALLPKRAMSAWPL